MKRPYLPILGILSITTALAGCQHATSAPVASNAPPTIGATSPGANGGGYLAPLASPVAVAGMNDVASLVERLKPTVVNITTISHIAPADYDGSGPFGAPFGPTPEGPSSRRSARALGTGFIVDPSGYVVTNAHVVQGADDIKVKLSDDREFPAKLVGKDTKLDLALVRISGATGLSAVTMGDSDRLRVGDSVIAIGNPFGLGHTVTLGITSAKDRSIGAGPYDAFIQTDASINPGNSGGALFNLRGEVVGIPTAIRQGAQGIGFAVPVNALKDVLPQLRDKGSVTRGKIGVRFQPLNNDLAQGLGLPNDHGALVSDVEPGGAGARAGIAAGDVITSVNGTPVGHAEDLPRMVARNAPGTQIKLGLTRSGKQLELGVTLDTLVDEDTDESPNRGSPSVAPSRGKLGVELEDVPGVGARVRGVAPDSPAAGQLMPGDVIVEIDRRPVKSASEVVGRVEAVPPGNILLLRVKRGQATQFVAVKLGEGRRGGRRGN